MKILVVDREETTVQLMKSKLEPLGHVITHEPVKNKAVEHMLEEPRDIIFLDPSPLKSAQQLILDFRKSTRTSLYIAYMGENIEQKDAVMEGANDSIQKPFDPERLDQLIDNARYLTSLIYRINDDTKDYPSANGIISKSAFNQLFLSAIDRATRYGEKSFVVFIRLTNYQDIYQKEGPYEADYTVARLSKHLVMLRRQSDIIAQTEHLEFALLLQRPQYESEPADAANRFAEALDAYHEFFEKDGLKPELSVTLVELPMGSRPIYHSIKK